MWRWLGDIVTNREMSSGERSRASCQRLHLERREVAVQAGEHVLLLVFLNAEESIVITQLRQMIVLGHHDKQQTCRRQHSRELGGITRREDVREDVKRAGSERQRILAVSYHHCRVAAPPGRHVRRVA